MQERNPQSGDLMLIVDEHTSRCNWPLARVLEVYRGDDALVRSALVKSKQTTLVRPVTKLCLLESAA